MSVDRGFTWMDDETLSLIDIFSTEEIQKELNGSKRNIGIYERIASELSNIGFKRTAYQCREKIKRLRKEYHQVKYCIENNMTPKKQMKYYELVDKIFNNDSGNDSTAQSSNIDLSILSSDHEDEIHFTFNNDLGSDASNSCTVKEPFASSSLQLPPCSPLNSRSSTSPVNFEDKTQDSFCNSQNNSEDTLLNGLPSYDLSDQDDTESLWVPNVVLVENDDEDTSVKDSIQAPEDFEFKEKNNLRDFNASPNETFLKDPEQPPHKRRRREAWFKEMFDNVTDTFLTYQEGAENRFLERITQIEQERMKRDENMHRLWLEFEERRRKEEQQHELKMLSLLGQFFQQVNGNESQNNI